LAGQGFNEVYNLKGGIMAWHGLSVAGPAEVGMAVLRGDETPAEIIVLAYGMEEGLRSFYETMASQTPDHEVSALFGNLAGIEVLHKEKLYKLYKGYDSGVVDMEGLESKIEAEIMEGGLTAEEFIAQNRSAMKTVPDILDVAMMIEGQALDLYMRYSQKTEDRESKETLYDIAEEEKAHLAALGDLRGARA
jgi:rubrerythrin